MAENNDPSIGEVVDAGKTVAEAVETGGASLAADPMATARLAKEAPKILKKGIKWQLGCCAAEAAVGLFVFLFVVGMIGGPGSETDQASAGSPASSWAGSTDTVSTVGRAKMPATSGKIGHEQHASKQSCFKSGNKHYDGPNSYLSAGSVSNCMAFGKPRTTDQERWYFNMRWDTGGNYPNDVMHKKIIITNPKNGKRIVASIEEYGPAARLMTRDGINSGASPEVYKYLGLENPYTGNPNDKKGYATFGFAKDQDIPLGPLE